MPPIKDPIVGQLNPSQLLYTYGIGALVDLPQISAIVTDSGGMTCHAAIVSRELGLPCVVGTRRGHLTRGRYRGTSVFGSADGVLEVALPGERRGAVLRSAG